MKKFLSLVLSLMVSSYFLVVVGSFLPLAGCSSERHIKDIAVHPRPSDNPSEEMAALERDLNDARQRNVHLLSPTWFASADKSLTESRNLRDHGGDFTELFRHLAEGRAALQRANEFAQTSNKMLPDVLQARERALGFQQAAVGAGATDLEDMRKEFQRAEDQFQSLAKAVENDDMKKVDNNRADTIKTYRLAETKAIKKEKLGTAQRIVDEAIQRDAKKYAPKTLAFTENFIKAAEQYISSNPTSEKEIQNKSNEAVFYARRLLRLTQESRLYSDRKPEDNLLWFEEGISSVSSILGSEDRRDRGFDEQLAGLKESAERVKTNQSEASQLRSQTDRMGVEARQARALAAHELQLNEVAKGFTKDEAEVLRQGNKVIIRVRGIKFPVGQSRLGPENFALLGRVQKVVEEFPKSTVTIEGHTDSSGPASLNARLSQERAEAVKEYLSSNNTVTEEQLSAVGMGFNRPIATNKTAEGRAANRRIDVVIVPAASVQHAE